MNPLCIIKTYPSLSKYTAYPSHICGILKSFWRACTVLMTQPKPFGWSLAFILDWRVVDGDDFWKSLLHENAYQFFCFSVTANYMDVDDAWLDEVHAVGVGALRREVRNDHKNQLSAIFPLFPSRYRTHLINTVKDYQGRVALDWHRLLHRFRNYTKPSDVTWHCHIFRKAKVPSNKNVHNFWHHFVLRRFMPL